MTKEELAGVLDLHQKWLDDEPVGVRANLSGAILYGADLSGADLYGAILSGANLSGANLYGAILSGANLSGANLYGADLHGAKGIISLSPMPTSRRLTYAYIGPAGLRVQAGCFNGTVEELREKVKSTHNCPVYLAWCDLVEAWAKIQQQ